MVSPRNRSGGAELERPLCTGTQIYQTNQSQYPLTEPVNKLEALKQTSGKLNDSRHISMILKHFFQVKSNTLPIFLLVMNYIVLTFWLKLNHSLRFNRSIHLKLRYSEIFTNLTVG